MTISVTPPAPPQPPVPAASPVAPAPAGSGRRSPARAEGRASGHPGTAVLLVLGSCTSFQFGAALATHLFPITGAPGATLLRLGLAALVLLAVTRPAFAAGAGRSGGRSCSTGSAWPG